MVDAIEQEELEIVSVGDASDINSNIPKKEPIKDPDLKIVDSALEEPVEELVEEDRPLNTQLKDLGLGQKMNRAYFGFQDKRSKTPSPLDSIVGRVAAKREEYNLEGKTNAFATEDGKFDFKGATYEAYSSLSKEERNVIDRLIDNKPDLYDAVEDQLEDVGPYYTFNKNTETKEYERIPTDYMDSAERSLPTFLNEGVRATVTGFRDLGTIAVGATGEAYDYIRETIEGSNNPLALDDYIQYKDQVDNYPELGTSVNAGEFGTKFVKPLVIDGVPIATKARVTEESKERFAKGLYTKFEIDNQNFAKLNLEDEFVEALLGTNKFGGPLSGVVEGIDTFSEKLDTVGLVTQRSIEYGRLKGRLSRGDVLRRNIYAEMLGSFGVFDDAVKFAVGSSLRKSFVPSASTFAPGGAKKALDLFDAETFFIKGGDNSIYDADWVASVLDDSNAVSRSLAYVMGPLNRLGILGGYTGPGTKITQANSIKYLMNNPSLTKSVLTYSFLALTMGDYIESVQDQTQIDFMGFNTPIESSSAEAHPVISFGGTIVGFIGPVTGAHLAWNSNAAGSFLNIARVIPESLTKTAEGLENFAKLLKEIDDQYLVEESAKVIKNVGEFVGEGVDNAIAARIGLSSEYYSSLSPEAKDKAIKLLGNKENRNFLINMVEQMRAQQLEDVDIYNAGRNHFFEMMGFMEDLGNRMRQIKKEDGSPKYDENQIAGITQLSFGEIMGMPLIKGLEQNIASGSSSLALSPVSDPAKAIVDQNNQAIILGKMTNKSKKSAVIIKMVIDDIQTSEGYNKKDFTNNNLVILKRWADETADVYYKDIATRAANAKKLIEEGYEGSLEANLDRIELEVTTGADPASSVLSFNSEDYLNVRFVDRRFNVGGEVITSGKRYNLTQETKQNTKEVFDYILNDITNTKKDYYNAAFTYKDKDLVLSKKRFNELVTEHRESSYGEAAGNSGGELKPKFLTTIRTYTKDKDNKVEIIQNKYTDETVTEALEGFEAQATTEIDKLKMSIKDADPKSAKTINTQKKINKIKLQQAAVDNALTSNDPVINNRKLAELLKTKEFTFFDFKYYALEDINRTRGIISSAVAKRNPDGINKIRDLDAYNYILDSMENTYPEVIENLQNANYFYRTTVAPVIKTSTGNKYLSNKSVGQSLLDESDVLLNLLKDMEAEDFVNLIRTIKDKDNKADTFSMTGYTDSHVKLDEPINMDIGDAVTLMIKQRMALKEFLQKGNNDFKDLEEKFNYIENNADWWADGTNESLAKMSKDGSTSEVISEFSDAQQIDNLVVDKRANRQERQISNTFAGAVEPSTSTSEIIRNLSMESRDLSQEIIMLGDDNFKTVSDQILALPSEQKIAARNVIQKGIIDEYMFDEYGGLKMVSVISGGENISVPAIFEVMRKNEEMLTELLGEKSIDDLAFLTKVHTGLNNPALADKVFADEIIGRKFNLRTRSMIDKGTGQFKIGLEEKNVNEELYYSEFKSKSSSVNYSGVSPEAGSQVLGSRFYNMARGFVSPQFVAIEFYIKSLPQGKAKLIENILSQGPEAAGALKDMFFDGNYSQGIGRKRIATNMAFAMGITGDPDGLILNEEDSMIDFSKFKKRTPDGTLVDLTDEDKQVLANQLIAYQADQTDDQMIQNLEDVKDAQ